MRNLRIVTKAIVLCAGLALAACGGSDGGGAAEPTPDTTDGDGHAHGDHHDKHDGEHMGGEHGDKHEHADGDKHEHDFPPAMDAFHGVMAPLWHADQGDQRLADTCAKTADFHGAVQGVYDAGAPEGVDASTWDTAFADLAESVNGLEITCNDNPGELEPFQDAFKGVHDAFHALMAAMGMKH
jgi:hypothetical protein